MSANNSQRNNNSNQGRASDVNRIRGPTSALTSFLREHGIRVENRSRQEMRERRRQRREELAQSEAQSQSTDAGTASTDSAAQLNTTSSPSTSTAATESILYTPASSSSSKRRSRSTQAKAIIDAATSSNSKSKKKKRPADDSSDDDFEGDSEDDDSVGPSSYRTRSSSARIRVLFCSSCKGRFIRNNSDPSEETLCPTCLSGNDPNAQQKPKRRVQARNRKSAVWFMHDVSAAATTVSSLQEICINVIADHIDDVEVLGDISFINMDKIAKIICRKRQLTNEIARLFMQPYIRELCLYDCTNVDVTGLKNIAHFCPNLRTLQLYYCGRMTDEVIELYGTHLRHLTSLTVSGCHLVTDQQWTRFFETVGDRLVSFSIRHSYRFKMDSFRALVTNCNKLQHLKLSRIVTLSNDWLEILSESGISTLEALEISWPSPELDKKCVLTTGHLNKILAQTGACLQELILRGCTELTDDVLVDGILPHCHQLRKLTLEGCNDISSDAFQQLFSKDGWKLKPVYINRQAVTGLQSVSIARCLNFDDIALMALLQHSGKTLTRLDIHSLEKLTVSSLEAIAGQVDKNTDKDSTPNGYVTGDTDSGNAQHKRLKLDSSATTITNGESDLTACTSLVYLDASFVRAMDDYVLAKLIQSCPNLRHVKVWGCHQVTDIVKVPPQLTVEGREFI